MYTDFFLIILTIALSAFFSGAEVAIVSTSKLKAEQLHQKKTKNSKSLLFLKNKPSESLITILIGNNVTNIASSVLATKISYETFNNTSVGLITGFMTLIILTFGEIIPKTFVAKNSKRIALAISPFLVFLMYVFYPFVKGFAYISNISSKILNTTDKDPLVTESEIKYLVQVGEKEGEINNNEKQIINKVFKLDDVSVQKIMTPEQEIFSLDWNLTVEQATPLIIENGYTRIPVHYVSKSKIKGMLTVQDVMSEIYKGNNDVKLKNIMNPIYFVNKNKKLDETLRELQLRNCHMAIVLDNLKGVIGLITVEDILEELVGEIFDEEDKLDTLIQKISDTDWVVKGQTFIRAINKKLNINLPISNDFKPISKFLSERLDFIETGKEYIDYDNKVIIKIKQSTKGNIKRVLIKKIG